MTELALDDVERHAFAGELDGVGVAQLMRREAPAYTGLGGKPTELDPGPGARPGPAASGAVDDAEQRPDRQLDPVAEPGRQLLPPPGVHADLAPTTTLALAHEQRPPPRIEVALAQRERLLDTEPGAPEHDDQRPQASAVAIVGSSAHHRDDLLDGRRVGGIELPLVAGAGDRRGTPAWLRAIAADRRHRAQ